MEPTHLPEQLAGDRIALKRADPPRVDALSVALTQWERFSLYLPELERQPASSTGARLGALLAERRVHFEEYAYELRTHATSAFLGHASVHALMWKHGCAEIAYWVRAEAEGQGYVREAVGVLEAVLFAHGFQRVEIRCDTQNSASAAVARRAGYALDGILRAHMRRRDGSYRSSFVFGKLRADAEAACQSEAASTKK